MKHAFLSAALCLSPAIASADTIAHWKIEGKSDKYLKDEKRDHDLTSTCETVKPSGTALVFPGNSDSGMLSAPDHKDWSNPSQTIEVFIKKGNDDGFASMVGHFKGDIGAPERQWLFVLKNAVPFIILQDADGKSHEISSGFQPLTLDHEYYLGVTFDLEAKDPDDRVVFYMKDLTKRGRPERAKVASTVEKLSVSNAPLSIGSTGNPTSRFIGEIGEVRISSPALKATELLMPR
jgi:hypothetical protein